MGRSQIKSWFKDLSRRKIEIEDIDTFGEFAYLSVQNAYRLYLNSHQDVDLPLKIFLLALSIEELAKPIILAELVPLLHSQNTDFKNKLVKYLESHSAKHFTIGVYGEHSVGLNYKITLTDSEIKKIEEIKQQCLYSDIKNKKAKAPLHYYKQDNLKVLATKLSLFVEERLTSFKEMYFLRQDAIRQFRIFSFRKIFDPRDLLNGFLRDSNLDEIVDYNDLVQCAKKYVKLKGEGLLETELDLEHPFCLESAIISMVRKSQEIDLRDKYIALYDICKVNIEQNADSDGFELLKPLMPNRGILHRVGVGLSKLKSFLGS